MAEYFYDNQNKLIKKYVTEHLGNGYQQEWASYSDEFEYQNGLVSKIIHKDISHDMFSYETYIYYNSGREITKTEVFKNGQQNYQYLGLPQHLLKIPIYFCYQKTITTDIRKQKNSQNKMVVVL